MKQKKTMVAVAILSMIALAGSLVAQNQFAGTYRDPDLSKPQRVELAWAELGREGATEGDVTAAARSLLTLRPVVHLYDLHPGFADAVLADSTLGGKVGEASASLLWTQAVLWKADATLNIADKIAWLEQHLSAELPPVHSVAIKTRYGATVARSAQAKLDAGDLAGALQLALPVAGYSDDAVRLIYRVKLAQRAPDLVRWAKLLYTLSNFRQTQAGIDAVSSALRAMDGHLARANAFIQFQKDGVGDAPLGDVSLPQVELIGITPEAKARQLAVAGKPVDALKVAVGVFATAPAGPRLNAATALVAQCLRNIDGNLVRANAFVETQSKGEPFIIAEIAP